MANIKPYTDQIQTATYGEQVRSSIIDALNKVNDDNNSYQTIKNQVVAAQNDVNQKVTNFNTTYNEAKATQTQLNNTINTANNVKTQLANASSTAETTRSNLQVVINNANNTRSSLENTSNTAVSNVNAAITRANTAKTNLDNSNVTATATNQNLQASITTATSTKTALDGAVSMANTSKANLDSAVTSANTTKGQVIQQIDAKATQAVAEVNAAKNELAMITGSVPSVTTTTNNALQAKCTRSGIEVMRIKGRTTQETTLGYQLFDASHPNLNSREVNGVKFFNNGDGSFSAFGTSINAFGLSYKIRNEKVREMIKPGTLNVSPANIQPYFYSLLNSNGNRIAIVRSTNQTQVSIQKEIMDSENDLSMETGFNVASNIVTDARSFKPMLYQDGDGTYEPYTGGKPAPNPDYPMSLNSFEANKIVITGTNVAVIPKTSARSKCTFEQLEDGTSVMKATGADAYVGIALNPGENYSISGGNLIAIPEGTSKVYAKSFDGVITKTLIGYFDAYSRSLGWTNFSPTITEATPPSGAKYIIIRTGVADSVAGGVYTDRIMVSFEPITEWTPPHYEEIELKNPLVLRSLPDGSCDEYLGDGRIKREVGRIEFNGSSNEGAWTKGSNPDGSYRFLNYKKTNVRTPVLVKNNQLCNRFVIGDTYAPTKDCFSFDNDQTFTVYSKKFDNDQSTADEFATWLSTHPLEVIYRLQIPTFEDYPMPILPSWDDDCRAYFISDTETEITWRPCPLSDPIKKVYELEQHLKALETPSTATEPETPEKTEEPQEDES